MFGPSVVWTVMLGAALLGAAAAFVGTFAVLRGRALVGDMLAHAALPGICAAFLLTGTRELLTLSVGALATGLLGVMCVSAIVRWTRTTDDAAIGIVLSTFFGAGVVLLTVIQANPSGNQAGIDTYLFGEIASLRSRDVAVIGIAAAMVVALVTLMFKELQVLSFDHDFAATQGWPTFWLDLAVMAAVAVVTIIGLPICGVILMAAMLITPAAAARFWTNRLGRMLVIAAVIGALSGVGGCLLAAPKLMTSFGLGWISTSRGMPPGPLIVLAGSALLLVSMFFAPERGLVARWLSEWRLRRRIARDHLLRALFELSEGQADDRPWIARSRLEEYGSWSPTSSRFQLWQAARAGFLEYEGDRIRFTEAGHTTAAQLVRAHRLWELYMVEGWRRSADQVHQGADDLEHLLPAEVVEHLEAMLQSEGRLPADISGKVPESPHLLDS
ncbi:MAG: iron chelate uptake ABC transporter family permease subunit [Aeoliella sp.]